MKSSLVPGAGSRGGAYADYSLFHPDETRCEAFRKRYGLEVLSRAVPLYDLRFVDEQRLPAVLLRCKRVASKTAASDIKSKSPLSFGFFGDGGDLI